MKEEKRKKRKENGRSPASALVNAPMTSLEIVITEKIGTTEIVIETGTRTGIGKEIVVVVIGIVLVNEDGIVVGTMSMVVIETETVIGSVIVIIALETGRGITKLGNLSMTVAVPMIILNQNMRGSDMGIGSGVMTTLPQKMTRVGLNNLGMAIGTRSQMMMLSPTSIIVASMINWMSSMMMTATNNILTVLMIAMIEWKRMITIMNKHQLIPVKGRGVEMSSEIIRGHLDHYLETTMSIKTEI